MRRDPSERVPLATRVRGDIYNRLIDAAVQHDRPLGNEIEMRLEQSFNPILPEAERQVMLLLGAAFRLGGPNAVIRTMYAMDDISPEDREMLRLGMRHTVDQLNPPAFVFKEPQP